jgi:hypothetical protein
MEFTRDSERYPVGDQNVKDFRHGRDIAIIVGFRGYMSDSVKGREERIDLEDRISAYMNLARARRGDQKAREELIDFAGNDAILMSYVERALEFSGNVPRITGNSDAAMARNECPQISDRNP